MQRQKRRLRAPFKYTDRMGKKRRYKVDAEVHFLALQRAGKRVGFLRNLKAGDVLDFLLMRRGVR